MIFPEISSSTLSHLSRRILMVLMIPLTTQQQNKFQAWDEKLNRRLNSQIYDDYKQVSMLSILKTESRGSFFRQINKSLDSHNINYFVETSCNKSYYHKSDSKLRVLELTAKSLRQLVFAEEIMRWEPCWVIAK